MGPDEWPLNSCIVAHRERMPRARGRHGLTWEAMTQQRGVADHPPIAGAKLRKANWLAEFLFRSNGYRATIHATGFWFLTMIPWPHNFNHEIRTFHKLTIVNKSLR